MADIQEDVSKNIVHDSVPTAVHYTDTTGHTTYNSIQETPQYQEKSINKDQPLIERWLFHC